MTLTFRWEWGSPGDLGPTETASRVIGAATDTYGYVGPTETTFETGASGTRSLLDLDGSRLAVKNGSTVSWVLFDLHGSVVALCTAGGSTLTDAYRYDGWGQTIATAGTSANPWKYRGLLGIDPSTSGDKLYDMGARDYAPGTGTFTQLDSVQGSAANPMTMNRFLYALANPATLIDPDGHMAACPTCDGGGTETDPEADDRSYECHGTSCNPDGAGGGGNGGGNSGGADPPPTPGGCDLGCENPTFTGYAPWEIDADPVFNELYAQAGLNCINQDYDSGECQFSRDLQGWIDHNKEVYCSYHRSECDQHDRGVLHTVLGGIGMIPVVGIVFNGADAMLYVSEGDGGGALIALASSVPLVGPLARVVKVGGHADEFQAVVSRANSMIGEDPTLLRTLLSERELVSARNGMLPVNYGKAVERKTAELIANDQRLSGLFRHVGGPGRADFDGMGRLSGRTFDVTTNTKSAIRLHFKRRYPNLSLGLYVRPDVAGLF